jgi:ATP-dependent Clp protease adaptor protein ClpS
MPTALEAPQIQQENLEMKVPLFHVVLLNDDDHSYEYVIEMLQRLFFFSHDRAYAHAVEVDFTGRTIVFTGSKEEAEFAQGQIHGYGADPRIPHCRGAMTAIIEPADTPAA